MVRQLRIDRKAFTRGAYIRKGGVKVSRAKVPRTIYLSKDMGKPNRTPKAKQWYQPGGNLHGYKISQPMVERRRKAAIGRDNLSSGRALQQLSNLSSSKETKRIAKQDAEYFFKKHKWEKR